MSNSKHEHQFGAIITDNEVYGERPQLIRQCASCGYIEVIGLQGNVSVHQFSERYIMKKPTCMETGYASLKCIKCGQKKLIELPLSDHHYIKNNPFYETCYDCHKKILTPVAKRCILISGTAVLSGGLIVGGICRFNKKLQSTNEHCVEDSNNFTTHETNASDKTYSSVITTCSISKHEESIQAALMPACVNEESSFIFMTPENDTQSGALDKESYKAVEEKDDLTAWKTLPAGTFTDVPEEDTLHLQLNASSAEGALEENIPAHSSLPCSSTAGVNESASQMLAGANDIVSSVSTEADTISDNSNTPEHVTAQTSAEKVLSISSSEMETETSTEHVETAAADDYSWLIGEILNGSDLLKLIEAGAPIEIITNTGMKLCVNTAISDAIPLSSTDVISEAASYTVNITVIDQQQVIVLNQF